MTLDQLSAEWRKYLDDKFPILLLDNAVDEGQVVPSPSRRNHGTWCLSRVDVFCKI